MTARWLVLLVLMLCGAARADTPIALYKSYAGNVNFVGTQVSLRPYSNTDRTNGACYVYSSSTTVTATLAGIPSGATILSAQLYWAGSGDPDYNITFEGLPLSAPRARQFTSATIGGGFDYFSGAVDVTTQVAAKRNGSYSFSGLTVDTGAPYCAAEGVVGGFSLLVIYSLPSETFRVLNLYEGFQYVRYSSVTLSLSNFKTPNPLGSATGRIAHITWEGDSTLSATDEDLLFNGVELYDAINPRHNQFNSASNINGDSKSYGIDFDAYTVGSTILRGGQTSVSTVYQSGQDLVLLGAEVIAVPNVATADIGVAISRNGNLQQGLNASYTLTVSNYGPNTEAGPVTVLDTLPAGMSFVSATGSNWSCSASGQIVTCTTTSPIPVGGSLPPITLLAAVNNTGSMTNSASVDGEQFDNNSANDNASDTATASAVSGTYVFTDSACVNGKAFGAAGQTCKQLTPTQIAATTGTVYVTALAGGTPTGPTSANSANFSFALGCVNPAANAGVQASYPTAANALPLCAANGAAPTAWSNSVTMNFAASTPSAPLSSFNYADVGKVQLYMQDASRRVVASSAFVVKPALLTITQVTRTADGAPNPAASNAAGLGFAAVGEPFTVVAEAWTAANVRAPNYGNEGALISLNVDYPADAAVKAAMSVLPGIGGGMLGQPAGGQARRSDFAADDAGILLLTPVAYTGSTANDYLGAGPVPASGVNVGRFYPDHFETSVSAPMSCLPAMGCPADVAGAAYSAQGVAAMVTAKSRTNATLVNYVGALATPVSLSAYSAMGAGSANPAGGSLAGTAVTMPADKTTSMTATPAYGLPNAFSNAAPRALNWTAPTPVYLRASATERTVNAAGAAVNTTVTSQRASGAVEGGLTIVSGRLSVGAPYGSELLKMPVRMNAQYWSTAGRWENSSTDNLSTVATAGIAFSNCLKNLGPPCKTTALAPASSTSVVLAAGTGTFFLKPPGSGNTGSAEFAMNNPAWLPSTKGRVVFGIFKSPLIYVREVF